MPRIGRPRPDEAPGAKRAVGAQVKDGEETPVQQEVITEVILLGNLASPLQ